MVVVVVVVAAFLVSLVVAFLVQRLRCLSGAGNGALVAVIWILREPVRRVSLGRLVNDQ